MSGQKHWIGYFGRRAVSGLLIGFGILLIVLTQFILTRFSTLGFVIGFCLIVAGVIGLLIRYGSGR